MQEKIKIRFPIIAEGKYDKNTLMQIFDCTVITTDGFAIFNKKEKQALLRRLGKGGVIVLTDSDGGGRQIRSFLSSIIQDGQIYNAYIPKIKGKEKRKREPSKSGFLGVEGMDKEVLIRALSPFTEVKEGLDEAQKCKKMITKVDFFEDKLTGADNSSLRRASLCRLAELPEDMSSNALLEAMNLLYGYEGYKELIEKLSNN